MVDELAHVQACAMSLKDQEAPFPINRVERLLQVDEDPVEGDLFNVGKLLRQLCLDQCSPGPSPMAPAVQAIMQDDCLKPMVHHPFDDLPDWFEEADATVIPASFRDEDSDDPPKLGGYLALVPNSLDKPNQYVPFVPCAHIVQSRLWVLLQLYAL